MSLATASKMLGDVVDSLPKSAACSVSEARLLTDRIRQSTTELWQLLAEAHDRQAWQALGYDSFKAYVEAEFAMSKQHAFRLLDQARIVAALNEVAESPRGDSITITEKEARDLKPHLDEVAARVKQATAPLPPAKRPAAAREVVSDIRQEIKHTGAPLPRRSVPSAPAATPPASPSAPTKPRRRPLNDVAREAGFELSKSIDRIERITKDDRFAPNRAQVATHLRSHLTHAVQVCQDLLDGLDTGPQEAR